MTFKISIKHCWLSFEFSFCYAESLSVVMLRVVMLSVVMLNVVMLSVVMQNVIILSVVAPFRLV
jgi:hypothetical protein